jgi:predicted RecA/RadA family phage recombinase
MAGNEHFRKGDFVSLPVASGKKSGDPVLIGSLVGVCATDRAKTDVTPTNGDGTLNTNYNAGGGNPTGYASVWLSGAHDFVVGFAANPGDKVYILADGSALTSTATSNTLFGHALSTKGATSGVLTVRIAN